jgi:hypothetical protein
MREPTFPIVHVSTILVAAILFAGGFAYAGAQSQEPKPVLPATPVAEEDILADDEPLSGVADSTWEGPNWGVSLSWDPAEWAVEAESIVEGYDGLQIGTPLSTVYIEAYEGFGGDADSCLADAERELGEIQALSEVAPLSDRPLPTAEEERGPALLLGVVATLEDGTPYRGIEYIECRTVVPGVAVVEITWRTATGAFNEDFPRVEELLATLEIPDAGEPAATPAATPAIPLATPVA